MVWVNERISFNAIWLFFFLLWDYRIVPAYVTCHFFQNYLYIFSWEKILFGILENSILHLRLNHCHETINFFADILPENLSECCWIDGSGNLFFLVWMSYSCKVKLNLSYKSVHSELIIFNFFLQHQQVFFFTTGEKDSKWINLSSTLQLCA